MDVRCLQATVWVSPMGIFSRTCHLADHLNVELPHVAGEALILREVQELGLPQVTRAPLGDSPDTPSQAPTMQLGTMM